MGTFVLTTRKNADGCWGSEFGGPTWLAGARDHDPTQFQRIKQRDWMDRIVATAKAGAMDGGNDIVFFVHGYNTSLEESVARQRKMQAELKQLNYDCVVVSFDWPTAGNFLAYQHDRKEALTAAQHLVDDAILPFIIYADAENCPLNIHVIAHSMGAFVVREAFERVDKLRNRYTASGWRIGQMVLFGADLSSDCFSGDDARMRPVFDRCGRLTNYFSGADGALNVSNIKHMTHGPRVGRTGMPEGSAGHDKAIDIDCTERYRAQAYQSMEPLSGMPSHSWYMLDPRWYEDLAHTLRGELDRNIIPTRTRIERNDFRLKP